jgi:hypothetical protein
MKIYCMDESCPNKIKGCSFCTALMKPEDCLKRQNKNDDAKKNANE